MTPYSRNYAPSFSGFSIHHDMDGDGIIAVYDSERIALHGSQQAYERFTAVADLEPPSVDLIKKVDPFFKELIDKWTE